jgi:hypothetical protein
MAEWDRSRDWVVVRNETDRAEVTVVFAGPRPSLHELAAVRRVVPDFQNKPPAEALARMGDGGRLEVDELPGPEARRMAAALQAAGVRVTVRNTSRVTYLPVDLDTRQAMLVEDEQVAEQLAHEMIRAGVPVEHIAE